MTGLWEPARELTLTLAYAGVTRFERTGWTDCKAASWVLDYLTRGTQRQRVEAEAEFVRESGLAALYAPGTLYHEYRTAGEMLDEAYMVFRATGASERLLRQLVQPGTHCHIGDPDTVIGSRLVRLGELRLHRQPGSEYFAAALLYELVGLLVTSLPMGAQRRVVRAGLGPGGEAGMVARVQSYILQHLARAPGVADLAAHVHMGQSAFAHAYSRLSGESPYRTVQRLRIARAKVLLLHQGLSAKETARQLGFSTAFNFSRVFKTIEGLSPRDYVRQVRRLGPGKERS